jgi:hypothetical protein
MVFQTAKRLERNWEQEKVLTTAHHLAARSAGSWDYSSAGPRVTQTAALRENPWATRTDDWMARNLEPRWVPKMVFQTAQCLERNWEQEKVLLTAHHLAARSAGSWDQSSADPKVAAWAHQLDQQTELHLVAMTVLRWGGY